ncbi:hypothetical protein FMM05_15605 [Flavobacterium zepuense]|uniref:Uncharacterized protein n=1 Tax=Flavobacterium zepuense TaxID=2593302 RepID=A0A552UY08_9FLAO|nr:hypothetical protein [Flavobacterium zepuense]TRW23115.1 hypothetical protein FMM05_15605 [Flavobacterium zepuense]
MKYVKLLAAFTFLLLSQICHAQDDPINKIEYSEINGGKGGDKIHLIVTKDSLSYSASGGNLKPFVKHIQTPKGMWSKLTAILPFDGFKMVKNGRSQLSQDGTDITLAVLSNNVKYVVFNGYDDPAHYQVLIPFISYLQDEVIPKAKK